MENNVKENIESEKGAVSKNPFSFKGRSGSANYLIYGIIVPLVIIIVGGVASELLKVPSLTIIFILVGFVMAMASMVRRGHDIGMTSVLTLILYFLSSLLIAGILSVPLISMQLFLMFGSVIGASIATFLLSNIFVVYLLFAPTSNQEIPKSSKLAKIIVGIIIGVFVIGILAAVIIPKLMTPNVDEAKRETVCLKMNDIKKRLDMFRLDNGVYPDTEEGLKALLVNPEFKKYPNYSARAYLKSLPNDSWGTPLIYINKGNDVDLLSFGPDKEKATKDDISFSTCK